MKYALLCTPLLISLAMPAQALECSAIDALPLALSPHAGTPQGTDTCFSFTTAAPGLSITAMNNIQVGWVGAEQTPFLTYRASIDAMTLTALDSGTVLMPASTQLINDYGYSPRGDVLYPAGQIASYANLAPGAYQLTLHMGQGNGGDYLLGIQSLAAVPEPGTAALMLAGLFISASSALRRRGCSESRDAL